MARGLLCTDLGLAMAGLEGYCAWTWTVVGGLLFSGQWLEGYCARTWDGLWRGDGADMLGGGLVSRKPWT